jgi:hypothetical protein
MQLGKIGPCQVEFARGRSPVNSTRSASCEAREKIFGRGIVIRNSPTIFAPVETACDVPIAITTFIKRRSCLSNDHHADVGIRAQFLNAPWPPFLPNPGDRIERLLDQPESPAGVSVTALINVGL